jgi:hypothetical protein
MVCVEIRHKPCFESERTETNTILDSRYIEVLLNHVFSKTNPQVCSCRYALAQSILLQPRDTLVYSWQAMRLISLEIVRVCSRNLG